jgi:hypothetical protein
MAGNERRDRLAAEIEDLLPVGGGIPCLLLRRNIGRRQGCASSSRPAAAIAQRALLEIESMAPPVQVMCRTAAARRSFAADERRLEDMR